MAPEIGSLRALANGESQFVGSSSGVYFINTVKRAFATPDATAADTNQHAATGAEPSDDPSPEDCIVGGGEDADITAPGSRPEHEETTTTSGQSDDHGLSSPFSSTGRDFMDGMNNLPDYSVARELVLAYFRIWHPLVPFLQGPDCLAELESLYRLNSRPGSHKSSSVSLLVTFRCIFNIARLEKDGPVDMGSTAIRSPSDLLPVLSVLALRCDTASIQALLCAQVYFISTMSLRHASSVSGLISKSIFQSGMHRCPVRYEHLSPDERSMRKRIFWSFYVLDRFVSQSLGHPNGIQDSDIDVCPPGQRDLHEPVVKSGLSPGSADDTTLHLPSNHPGRVATPSAGQTQGRDPSPETESEQEDQEQVPGGAVAAQTPAGDESRRSAAIVRHRRETQAVLENHVRHSKLVGRVLEVFHKSIHARHLDNQTVLFLKADVSAFGNDLTQPRLARVASDMPSLTPDPTVFPFISYHYTVLLLNRPSLSLEPGRAEFQEALQTCIAAAKVIIQTIRRYAEHGGPLFWPGYMSAVWMSGLVLALAARLKLYNKSKAKSAVHVALELLTTMTSRWAMARHCKEVLSILVERIDAEVKGHKRGRRQTNLLDDTAETHEGGGDLGRGSEQQHQQHHGLKSPLKRRRTTGHKPDSRNSFREGPAPMSPRVNPSQAQTPASIPRRQAFINARAHESRRSHVQNSHSQQCSTDSPQSVRVDEPQFTSYRQPEANQFVTPPIMNAYGNTASVGPYFAPIPITFPDRQRDMYNQYVDQFDGADNFFDMFDGATWGSLLDIVDGTGGSTNQ
ncbi:putative Zn(II)2Cys6 transcription factor [Colletotrichum tabaci]|uniref:Zn(II)2Cys6 transcription factor n=1 Tax=Colletotrichum tabaci TaxID=1209068 RepID=A0AAV9SU57_9PEZI